MRMGALDCVPLVAASWWRSKPLLGEVSELYSSVAGPRAWCSGSRVPSDRPRLSHLQNKNNFYSLRSNHYLIRESQHLPFFNAIRKGDNTLYNNVPQVVASIYKQSQQCLLST